MRKESVTALVVVLLASAHAIADQPPPEGYVEKCTVAKQQTASSECLDCSAWVSHLNRCTNLLAPYCYTRICKSYGASAWTEVLCRTKDPSAPAVPAETLAALTSPNVNEPYSADGGVDGPPATCAPYTPPTGTATDTSTSTNNDSGCNVATKGTGLRALGPLAMIFAALVLVLRRRAKSKD
jgi:MYXO-CTERM domain-containing protein